MRYTIELRKSNLIAVYIHFIAPIYELSVIVRRQLLCR